MVISCQPHQKCHCVYVQENQHQLDLPQHLFQKLWNFDIKMPSKIKI